MAARRTQAASTSQLSFLPRPVAPSEATVQWGRHQLDVFRFVEDERRNGIVIARAGSGKTRVLLEALRRLPGDGDRLLVAFNVVIAQELARRCPGVEARTLHSLGLGALRRHWGISAIHPVPGHDRRVVEQRVPDWLEGPDRTTIVKLVRMCKAHLAWRDEEIESVAAYLRLTIPWDTYRKNGLLPPTANNASLCSWVRACLDAACRPSMEIAYDDMIYVPAREGMPIARAAGLFVDEVQDLTAAQVKMLRQLKAPDGRLIAVGDDLQAIYQFRGADRYSIAEIRNGFDAKVLTLPVTYRCARAIVDVARRVAPDLEPAPGAPMGLVRHIRLDSLTEEVQPEDMVISRTNAPLVDLCLDTGMLGKPVQIRGKDLGSGLVRLVGQANVASVADFLPWLREWAASEGERLLDSHKENQAETLYDRVRTLERLCSGLRTTRQLRDRISIIFGDDITGCVQFSSTHRAKGLEARRVFMLEDTYCPIEPGEESNLWYVAVTRAREELAHVHKA